MMAVLRCSANSIVNLFDRSTIEELFESYQALLCSFVDNPEQTIAEAAVLSVEQKQRSLVEWNQTDLEYPVASTVHQEFARQVSETPQKRSTGIQQ